MEIALRESFTGGLSPTGRPLEASPLAIDLALAGRGLVEVALGAPFDVQGTFTARASASCDAGATEGGALPSAGVVRGTARLLVPRGVFYDLRLAAHEAARPAEVLTLEAARRFVRGDLYVSSTTLQGELRRGDRVLAVARLRFDARDDLGALFRSLRLGRSGILPRGRLQ